MGGKDVDLWRERPDVIKEFLDRRSAYTRLAEEVAYMLEVCVAAAGIKYAQTLWRVKELNSFCEKVERKKYAEPLQECTDIAGVRIVFLYISDLEAIVNVISEQFNIIERVDKVQDNEVEKFGYSAVHYLVKIGEGSVGARYDELKELVCEIQVRTILQDAWAIVGHHLTYKRESEIPKKLRRKLNALAGLFETADDQFDRVKRDLSAYAVEMKEQFAVGGAEYLKRELDLDNFMEYLNWKFPDRKHCEREHVSTLLSELIGSGITDFGKLENFVNSRLNKVLEYEKRTPPTDLKTKKKTLFSDIGLIRSALTHFK